jgi:intracellular sulfur oxidation DsrE/DsrF family protein
MIKKMKLIVMLLIASYGVGYAQHINQPSFENLISKKAKYKVVFQLNSGDEKVIESTLKNIANSMADSKLKNQITIELVVHGNGVVLFMKDHPYEKQILDLKEKGVILVQCLNTLKNKNISKEQLFPFIYYVESGVAEIIYRQHQGWAYIHP